MMEFFKLCSNQPSVKKRILVEVRSHRAFTTIAVAAAVFSDYFTYGMLLPILPFALEIRAGTDPENTQKWISAMLSTFGASLFFSAVVIGWWAERISTKRIPFLCGLFALAGSQAILMTASNVAVMLVGRALQGFSSGLTSVVGLALLTDTVGTDRKALGQAMGYIGLSMNLAFFSSSLLAGIVFSRVGYYAVFTMAFALIAIDAVLRFSMIARQSKLDIQNSEVLQFQVQQKTCIQPTQAIPALAVNELSNPSAEEDPKVLPFVVSSVCMSSTTSLSNSRDDSKEFPKGDLISSCRALTTSPAPGVAKEKAFNDRSTSSLLPHLGFVFGSGRILSALWATFTISTIMTAFDAVLPSLVKDSFGWTSTGAGLIFLPFTIGSFTGPLVGWMCDRFGARWFATAGFILAGSGLMLLRLVVRNDMAQKIVLCVLLSVISLGLTLVVTPIMAEIAHAVDAREGTLPYNTLRRHKGSSYAKAYSLFTIAWALGSIAGPLLAGLVRQNLSWSAAALILGSVSITTAVPTAVWTGGRIR